MIATEEARRGVLAEIDRAVDAKQSPEDVLQQSVELLHDRFDDYTWVGVYLLEGSDLVLAAWRGAQPTEHVRIPIGVGICGAAAASGQTEIVDDVQSDPRYLACFASTRSEIVVPVRFRGEVVGEIDVDSDGAGAFDETDRAFLEHVARMISSPCAAALGRSSWGRG